MDKIETYIGFSIRKGAAVFGVDNICVYRKKMYIVAVTDTLAPKSKANVLRFAEERGISVVTVRDYDTLVKHNCKAVGICDKSLADAIAANVNK